MTVNGSVFQFSSYQSFSYSSLSVSAFQAPPQTSAVDASNPAASSSSAAPSTDTVTLSPQAGAQAGAAATSDSGTATTTDGAAPTGTSISASPADDRATALFKALDANQDGSVTEDEFKAGAKALLRQGRANDRAEGARHGEHGHHGGRRLERALERTFNRLDSNGDGALTKDELASALSSTSKPSAPVTSPNSDSSTNSPTATSDTSVDGSAQKATSTFVSLTVVSIAIRTYTAVGQSGASNAPATNSDQLAPAVSTPGSAPTNAHAPVKAGPFLEPR